MEPKEAVTDYSDAKHLLDSIGKKVHDKVHNEAIDYVSDLKGLLERAAFPTREGYDKPRSDPCDFSYEFDTAVTSGQSYPCGNKSEKRFSEVSGAECDEKKIKDSDKKNKGGACAPYRRLSLCDTNLEQIQPDQVTTTDNLLVDVCLAAKYEGESLKNYHAQYQEKYVNSRSQLCTVLARSFADIGDIIRGKDLYRGNNKKDQVEKEGLEKNLQKIFGHIYEELIKKKTEATKRYENDDKKNYYQLREDWWTANRHTVWKAITCKAEGNKYFRPTCSNVAFSQDKCHCANADVPTNFDYVPQYLRWFEEWAEDFCTKRKHKLQNAKEQCREGKDQSGGERYCDFNGYDCKGTASGKHKYLWDYKCAGCFFSCSDFRKWIAKQKDEFEKQKKKCEKEIGKAKNTTQVPNGNISNIYEKEFYTHLEEKYKTVDAFLNLLNKETACEKRPHDGEKIGPINFTNANTDDIFSPTEYCEPCPWCGVKGGNGKWERIDDRKACEKEELYTPKKNATYTKINVLTSGEGHEDIETKLEAFCAEKNGGGVAGGSASNSDSQKLYEEWKCYQIGELQKDGQDVVEDEEDVQKVKAAGGLCILEKTNSEENVNKQKTFNNFFNFWVAHVLKDSIEWRTQLTKCLSEDKLKKCEKGCKSNCECFKKWIEKKEQEWIEVKDQFNKQTDFGVWKHYLVLEKILEDYYFENIQKAYGDLKSIQEMKKMIQENQNNQNRSKDDVDALDVLFDHELEEAEDCLDIHEDDDDDDECVEESEKIPNNPCSGESGGSGSSSVLRRYPAVATKVAHQMHKAAKTQLTSRGGRKALRGDASQGHYNGKAKKSVLKDVCDITNQYSNAIGASNNPCNGKDNDHQRFNVGTSWISGDRISKDHKDVYLPPRREHMCTSNLEFLDTDKIPFSGSNAKLINDSFLGDVLLSAKFEAEKIKELYDKNKVKSGQNDKNGLTDDKTVCRAMKYSFADLGDIIRGRDLWDNETGMKKIREYLPTIFGTIKKKVPEKYKDDTNNIKLREDWWEANRRQVWRAMKCATRKHQISCPGMLVEDYIPQRLRWMTEWAEWYCKYQAEAYKTLQKGCEECKEKKTNCFNNNSECSACKQACDAYNTKIQEWKDQWTKMEQNYLTLYLEVLNTARNGGTRAYSGDVGDKDKPVVEFFKELQKANVITPSASKSRDKRSIDARGITIDPTTPYFTAAGYIHQELQNMECQVQKEFCEKKNGGTTPTGTENKEYVFKDKPHDHDTPCNCDKPPKKDACEIVGELLKVDHGDSKVGECKPKIKDKNDEYPDWQCGNINLVEDDRVCMPPRRQKLCLYYLAHEKQTKNIETQDDLTDAFIKTAAAETFLSWQYYKTKNGDAEKKLEQGEIPPEFLRSMFYTYADYRDICLNSDISKKVGDVSNAKNKIDKIFLKKDDQTDEKKREEFWKENGKEIWKGMLCALTHASGNTETVQTKLTTKTSIYDYDTVTFDGTTKLDDFAKRHQFLRWFTEWAEDFCNHQEKELTTLRDKCNFVKCDYATPEQKSACQLSCNKYKKFLNKWEEQYIQQYSKYDSLEDTISVITKKQPYEYLKVKCGDRCSCLQKRDGIPVNNAFVYPPKEVEGKCPCPLKPAIIPQTETITPRTTKSEKPRQLYTDHDLNQCPPNHNTCNYFSIFGTYKKKYHLEDLDKWNTLDVKDPHGTNKGVLVPPRRNQIYVRNIISNAYHINDKERFKKELLKDASNEAKLLWDYYNGDSKKALESMKYSFADYGNIVKGTDMIDTILLQRLHKKLNEIFATSSSTNSYKEREIWWDENKNHVWNIMMCYYKDDNLTKSCPSNDNIDKIDQFFRWFTEWAVHYCSIYKHEHDKLQNACEGVDCSRDPNDKYKIECKNACKNFKEFLEQWKENFERQKKKYDIDPHKEYEDGKYKEAHEYLYEQCKNQCKCIGIISDYFKNSEIKLPFFFGTTEKETGKCVCSNAKKSACNNDEFPKGRTENQITCNDLKKYIVTKDTTTTTASIKKENLLEKTIMWKNIPGKDYYFPPRTEQLCLSELKKLNDRSNRNDIMEYEFSGALQKDAYNEAIQLYEYYKTFYEKKENLQLLDDTKSNVNKDEVIKNSTFSAMKYSYADYADLIKGTTLYTQRNDYNKIKSIIDKVQLNNSKIYDNVEKAKYLWLKYKADIWNSMLCGYKEKDSDISFDNNMCTLPNDDETHEFLRWFTEWAETFCFHQTGELEKLKKNCSFSSCETAKNKEKDNCLNACGSYKSFLKKWQKQYKQQYIEYENLDNTIPERKDKGAHEFFKNKCNDSKCDCFFNNFLDKNKTWKNTYETLEETLKGKCECKKIEPKISPAKPIEPEYPPLGPKPATPLPPLPNDEPINTNILSTTIPLGIALSLSSIAFLFLKKKPKSPVDLIRVLDIHKGDYDIPTLKSSNRYIPYVSDTYKGRTYIYMEGDTSGDDDKYAFMSDTTDITSSESEYEEMDINDIYVPGSPKYKTSFSFFFDNVK
ncbi:hypothetical protein PFNF135_01702 [Plasmodium falciparum NF135/5.C10]|uniref:Erythrocyte membrane protein 1, PfEMP1 n=1 Tax=Plasmodium falciparum NF135/5.C10 TaxID=1036726 RepID=W4ILD5_PLAFA|nr:hypothetical protein PFNF135_01702 [Plasmodium falciparum NF135/5.C10]